MVFWFLWFYPSESKEHARQKLLATIATAVVAISSGRFLATALPFRLRPKFDPAVVDLITTPRFSEWSSFPSDHAVLFFSLALCFLMINRVAGVLALLHATLIVSLPRIILGFHWPSDILGGFFIAMLVVFVTLIPISKFVGRTRLLPTMLRYEQFLYPFMFLITFQIATMFDSVWRVLFIIFNMLTKTSGS